MIVFLVGVFLLNNYLQWTRLELPLFSNTKEVRDLFSDFCCCIAEIIFFHVLIHKSPAKLFDHVEKMLQISSQGRYVFVRKIFGPVRSRLYTIMCQRQLKITHSLLTVAVIDFSDSVVEGATWSLAALRIPGMCSYRGRHGCH